MLTFPCKQVGKLLYKNKGDKSYGKEFKGKKFKI